MSHAADLYKQELVYSLTEALRLLEPITGPIKYDDATRCLQQRLEWIKNGDLDYQIEQAVK